MLKLTQYNYVDVIEANDNFVFYRGQAHADQSQVILKTSAAARPAPTELAYLEHEYLLIEPLDFPGILHTRQLIKDKQKLVLVAEYVDGIPLNEFLAKTSVPIPIFLNIALQLAKILGYLHQKKIVHRDIKPHNFIINPINLQITLIDLSNASKISQQTQVSIATGAIKGSVAYIAPEQTGRINHPLDHRCDLYSVGILFYELLTGKLPFEAKDPLEVIYFHLAVTPTHIHKIKSEVPVAIANLVAKLLEKNAKDRYASAYGLQMDLEECEKQWIAKKNIDNFELAKQDIYDHLHLSQKLYGRDEELSIIQEAFDRTVNGNKELVLLSGYSGIGKTSLAREIHKSIVREKGYLISGKFDELYNNIPYSAFGQLFQDLITQVLAEPSEYINKIKIQLSEILGAHAQVIIDVVPNLELIIGKQPAVEVLNANESQNRFHLSFKNFLRFFASSDHIVTIILDDLQWIDSASVQLMQVLLSDSELRNCLFIGTYHSNVVTVTHPLHLTIMQLKDLGLKLKQVEIPALTLEHLNSLVVDTLHCTPESAKSLSELLFAKTQGNPFFVNEFLKSLHHDEELKFSYEKHCWVWDVEQIKKHNIAQNVADYLIAHLHKLPKETQQLLQLAACIGPRFSLKTLATICEQSLRSTVHHLDSALQSNLITMLDEDYSLMEVLSLLTEESEFPEEIIFCFKHVRIQRASNELLEESQLQKTHLSIGRLLLDGKSLSGNEGNLFEILDHFNRSLSLLSDPKEKLALSAANLIAGKKARVSMAYQVALTYLKCGIQLLPQDSWVDHFSLTFNLKKEYAESTYLTGNIQEAERDLKDLLTKASNAFEAFEIYQIMIAMYNTQNNLEEALTMGKRAVALFGPSMPLNPTQFSLSKAIFSVLLQFSWSKFRRFKIKPMQNQPKIQKLAELYNQLLSIAYIQEHELFAYLACKVLNLSFRYGHTPHTAMAAKCYAFIMLHKYNYYKCSLSMAEFADQISNYHALPSAMAKEGLISGAVLNYWSFPAPTALATLQKAYHMALESGELSYANFNLVNYAHILYIMGKPLGEISKSYHDYLDFCESNRVYKFKKSVLHCLRSIEYIRGKGDLPLKELKSEIEILKKANSYTEILLHYYFSTKAYYFCGNYDFAIETGRELQNYAKYILGHPIYAECKIYYALALARNFHNADLSGRNETKKILDKEYNLLKQLAHRSPTNFTHFELLFRAEMAFIQGRKWQAIDLYIQTALSALENDFPYLVAVANECAARLYLLEDKDKEASFYQIEAHAFYQRWGAMTKVKQFEKEFPKLFLVNKITESASSTEDNQMKYFDASMSSSLDSMTVLKSINAISSEMEIDKLFKKLLLILLENAAAQRGILLSRINNNWHIDIEGGHTSGQEIEFFDPIAPKNRIDLPMKLINHVWDSREMMMLKESDNLPKIALLDPYVTIQKPKTMLLLPISYKGESRHVLFLENNLIEGAFTQDRINVLQMIATQAAISIENAQLYHRATHDPLTGLANRNLLNQLFTQRLMDIKEQGNIAILFLDLDHFKAINDNLGHEFGDKILIYVSDQLKSCIRENDLAVRLGGDEFVVMLCNREEHEINQIAQNILLKVEAAPMLRDNSYSVSVSIGISLCPKDSRDVVTLLKFSDTALYVAKQAGRNGYQYYQPQQSSDASA